MLCVEKAGYGLGAAEGFFGCPPLPHRDAEMRQTAEEALAALHVSVCLHCLVWQQLGMVAMHV